MHRGCAHIIIATIVVVIEVCVGSVTTAHHANVVLEIVSRRVFVVGLHACVSGRDVHKDSVGVCTVAQRLHALLHGQGAQCVSTLCGAKNVRYRAQPDTYYLLQYLLLVHGARVPKGSADEGQQAVAADGHGGHLQHIFKAPPSHQLIKNVLVQLLIS